MAAAQPGAHAKRQVRVGVYNIDHMIGSGSFAKVFRGQHRVTRQTVAVKAISRARLNKKLMENLESEISILKSLEHPNIVCLHDIQVRPRLRGRRTFPAGAARGVGAGAARAGAARAAERGAGGPQPGGWARRCSLSLCRARAAGVPAGPPVRRARGPCSRAPRPPPSLLEPRARR